MLAFAWAALLRRQVRRQTALIREQVEAVTVAGERQRIAREFHDTLEQELVGVSLRLDAANARTSDSMVRDLITGTQRLVHQLQAGARSFVWNLRESSLASQPLAEGIRTAAVRSAPGRNVEVLTHGEAGTAFPEIRHRFCRRTAADRPGSHHQRRPPRQRAQDHYHPGFRHPGPDTACSSKTMAPGFRDPNAPVPARPLWPAWECANACSNFAASFSSGALREKARPWK